MLTFNKLFIDFHCASGKDFSKVSQYNFIKASYASFGHWIFSTSVKFIYFNENRNFRILSLVINLFCFV